MRRILLITFEFPPNVGGAENYFFELVRRSKNVEIMVLAPPHPMAGAWDAEQSFTVVRKPFLSSSLFPHWLPLLWHAMRLVYHERIDVVWVGQVLPGGLVGWLVSRLFRRPFGIHANGMDVTVPLSHARKRWLMTHLFRAADFITTISLYTQSILKTLGSESRKIYRVYPCASLREVVENPTALRRQTEAWIKKKGWTGRRILLTVSRLVERKGHDRVIQALPSIAVKYPEALYVIGGDGPDRGRLEQLVHSLHLENQVYFSGKIADEELPFYFDACEIFIMACRELSNHDVEGFGIVFLEANLFGKPVIAGRSGGVPSAVEDHESGLLVDPNSEKEIAQAVSWLLEDRGFATKLGEGGRKRALERFNWDVQAAVLENMWKNL